MIKCSCMKKIFLLFCLLIPSLLGCKHYKYISISGLTKGEYYFTESEGNLPHDWVFTENSMFTVVRKTYDEQQSKELPLGTWGVFKSVYDDNGKRVIGDGAYKMVWNNSPFDNLEALYPGGGGRWGDGRCFSVYNLKNHPYGQVGDFPAVMLIYLSIDNGSINSRVV